MDLQPSVSALPKGTRAGGTENQTTNPHRRFAYSWGTNQWKPTAGKFKYFFTPHKSNTCMKTPKTPNFSLLCQNNITYSNRTN